MYDPVAFDVFDAVNQVRMSENISPLIWDDGLATLAQRHSTDIVEYAEPSHVGTDGRDPAQRGIDAGYVLCGKPAAINQYERLQMLIIEFQNNMNDYDILVQNYEQTADELDSLISEYNKVATNPDKFYILDSMQQAIQQKTSQLDLMYLQLQQTYGRLLDGYEKLYALYSIVNDSIAQGLLYRGVSENIILLENSNDIVLDAIQGWLDSPGHKENMLLSAWQKTGVGIAYDGNRIIITQNFC